MSNATLTHTCPKCAGVGTVPFKHIENGVCFLCDGAKSVTGATASRWLASEGRTAPAANRGPVAPSHSGKTIDLGACGKARIVSHGGGEFAACDLMDGGYMLCFTVSNGKVTVDQGLVQNGMMGHWRRFEAALQAALRA